MSKELEALKIMVKDNDLELPYHNSIQAIETALKEKEIIEKTINELFSENGKVITTIEIKKKLKALEIIKKVVKYDIEVNGNDIFDIEYEPNEMLTKEEYDLLKEVLL